LLVALIATYLVVLGAVLTKKVSLTGLRRKSKEFSERQTRQGRIGVLAHSAKEGPGESVMEMMKSDFIQKEG
jgi:hypothetical protein